MCATEMGAGERPQQSPSLVCKEKEGFDPMAPGRRVSLRIRLDSEMTFSPHGSNDSSDAALPGTGRWRGNISGVAQVRSTEGSDCAIVAATMEATIAATKTRRDSGGISGSQNRTQAKLKPTEPSGQSFGGFIPSSEW